MKRLFLVLSLLFTSVAFAQNNPGTGPTNTVVVQAATPWFSTIPLSATAAVGSPAVLTIPAPVQSGNYNYVCSLALEASADGTGAAVVNQTTTSTNFNSFAAKFSHIAGIGVDTGTFVYINSNPSGGCVKSAVAGTSTTFTSPTNTHDAYAWYASYYQAP